MNSRLNEIIPEYCDTFPDQLEHGKLYISKKFSVTAHCCACGCGHWTYMGIGNNGWTLTGEDIITIRPSVGNFKGENPYHAHYFITNNKIEWL